MKYEDKSCECGSHYIANRKYWLCDNCNYKRLHDGKSKIEVYKAKQKPIKRKAVKSSSKAKEKRKSVLEKDKELYLYIFNNKPNECENCKLEGKTTLLPDMFEDDEGNILGIWQYSHILGKGAFPQYRHHKKNMRRFCFTCHYKWDHGDKKSMPIYAIDKDIIKELRLL